MKNLHRLLLSLLAVALLIIFWQNRKIDGLQKDILGFRKTSSEINQLRLENARLSNNELDSAELARLRKDHSELLRLRGDVSRLRQQLKAQATTSKSPEQPASTTNDSPVEVFATDVEADVSPQQTLVTGGWAMPEGKRTFLLLEPALMDEAGNEISAEQAREKAGSAQVHLQAQFTEVPEEFLQALGLQNVGSGDAGNSTHLILNKDQSELLFRSLTNGTGVDILSAPRVTTLNGRQTQVSVFEEKTINNKPYTLGQAVDVIPQISADGRSIRLFVHGSISRERPRR